MTGLILPVDFPIAFYSGYGILAKSIGGHVHAASTTFLPFCSVAGEELPSQRADDVCSLGVVPFFRYKRLQAISNSR